MSSKRTSIAIDSETKEVLDWSMSQKKTRNFSEHTRKLLEKYHGEDWPQLLKRARANQLICEKHGKPYTLICKDCEVALCPGCRIEPHLEHQLQFFCRIHQVGYQTTCMLCERDRWEGIVDIPMITADELRKEMGNYICIDVRGDSEWKEGHLPGSYHIKWVDIRLKNSDGYKQLMDIIREHKNERWLFISQGNIKDKKPARPARGWLAAADLKTMHHVENVACLEGGWVNFHSKYRDIVEDHRSNGSCQICEFQR
jgi:rhodanese-related sulfurtransferase